MWRHGWSWPSEGGGEKDAPRGLRGEAPPSSSNATYLPASPNRVYKGSGDMDSYVEACLRALDLQVWGVLDLQVWSGGGGYI